jgi:flagellar secretion chaperone FliS
MNATLVKEFQGRIINATQQDLVVINYEMFLAEIDVAISEVNASDTKAYHKAVTMAHKLLRELSDNLDFQYEISRDLMSLYIYAGKKLIEASMNHQQEDLEEIKRIILVLLQGWKEAQAKVIPSQGIMIQNAQKVYAGLTYGKGSLNETVYQDVSRGFKA